MLKILCDTLLTDWCEALAGLQLKGTGEKKLDGAIWCPACGRIHGRCFEAMYPLLCLAHKCTGKRREILVNAANDLFLWAQANVSREDGSFINDIDSDWKGTTVFGAIQLADCLWFHKGILPKETKKAWERRLIAAADFLCGFEELKENNINYQVSNALALLESGLVLNNTFYIRKAGEWISCCQNILTRNALIYGEGIPREQRSRTGCMPVDIGYNVEETLPSLALYGWLTRDEEIMRLAQHALNGHLEFMLEDGGWDNSFGTRNFKWTYWGSRTSDGCALGYLLYAKDHPEYIRAAERNLELLRQCSSQGLLAGGPHYEAAGQKCCVHHTFTHAKMVAGILDRKLYTEVREEKRNVKGKYMSVQPETAENMQMRHYPEINTWVVRNGKMRATVTAYDWEYLPGGHVSGGALSLLYEPRTGVLLCAGMGVYWRKEPANMQLPEKVRHECLGLRIEQTQNGEYYSSLFEDNAKMWTDREGIYAKGYLKNIRHRPISQDEAGKYEFRYRLGKDRLDIEAQFDSGILVFPLISRKDEKIEIGNSDEKAKGGGLLLHKGKALVRVNSDSGLELPYGTERIFNLVPGMQAIRIEGKPKNGRIFIRLEILEGNKSVHENL